MSYAKKATQGIVAIFVAITITMFLGYLIRLFLSRGLSAEDFGLFYAVLVFFGFFNLFRDIGLNQALIRFIPTFREKRKIKGAIFIVLKIQGVFAAIITSLIIFFAEPIALYYFHTSKAILLLQVIAISFFAGTFLSLWQSTIQGLQKNKILAILQPLNQALNLIFIFLLIGLGIFGVSFAFAAGAIGAALVATVTVMKEFPLAGIKAITNGIWPKLKGFAIPVMIGFIGGTLLGVTDTMVITYFRSLEEVAFYQVAMPTSQVLWLLGTSIATILLPLSSDLWARKKKKKLKKGLSIISRVSIIIILPFTAMMIAFPNEIITILFGSRYALASPVLQIAALSAIFYTAWVIFSTTISGMGFPAVNTKIVLAAALINLTLNIILVQTHGITGVAFATLFSFILLASYSYLWLKRKTNMKIEWFTLAKGSMSAIFMLILIIFLKQILVTDIIIELVTLTVTGLTIYTILILSTKAVTKSDIKMLQKSMPQAKPLLNPLVIIARD